MLTKGVPAWCMIGAIALLWVTPASAKAQVRAPPPSAPRRSSAFATAKAEMLLRTRLPCLGCHELGGQGGRIGPSLSNVGARRDRAYILSMVRDPERTFPGTVMPKVPMDSSTASLVADFLSERARGPEPPPVAPPAAYLPRSGAAPGDAAALYLRSCAPCHGLAGDGDGYNAVYLPVPPTPHSSLEYMSTRSNAALFDAIAGGGYIMARSARMPAFGRTLSPAQIRGLVSYLRVLCRCEGPAWSRDDR